MYQLLVQIISYLVISEQINFENSYLGVSQINQNFFEQRERNIVLVCDVYRKIKSQLIHTFSHHFMKICP